ncbi:MAG: tetratricopeptide repeat protein, partial [Acidobacteriaceae bacterium]|nr:tetratricopeptide repeat protein [Acidobacteriaceae bacterium]
MLLAYLPVLAGEQGWDDLMKQGFVFFRSGEFQNAIEKFRAAEQLTEVPGASLDRRAYSLNGIAMVYDELGRFTDAEKNYRRALASMEQFKGREDTVYASMLANLGGSFSTQGRLKEGEQMLREAIAIHQRLPSSQGLGLAMAENRLAKTLMTEHSFSEVDDLLTDAIKRMETVPDNALQLAMAMHNRGAFLAYIG